MRMFVLAASFAALSPAQDPQDYVNVASCKAAFAAFKAESGGQWIAQWHTATGTPSAIYGTGLALADWRENSIAEARRHALAQLEKHNALLGLGDSDFRELLAGRMGRTWSFVFEQYYRGLPVIDGRADVRINMRGVVAMLGSQAFTIPKGFNTVPAIAEEVAVGAAWAKVGSPTGVPQPAPVKAPRLVIWGDMHATDLAPVHLAWEVAISNVNAQGEGPIGRYYVDAATGAVLTFVTDKHECGVIGCNGGKAEAPSIEKLSAPPVPTTVTVMGWTRTGNDAYSALVNVPMPGLVINVPGIGNVTTNANGEFSIDIAAATNITVGTLDGRHHNPINGANAPAANVVVNPGVPTTIQLFTAAATTNEAAHTTTSWYTDATNEYCRAILGNTSQLATASNIGVTVNIASTCNAYYTGNTINFYSEGGGCANTAFSTVVAHEWGHGIDDRYGGIANSNAEGLSEGWGDIIGCYLNDTPLLGSGFQSPGVALRNGNNTLLWPASGGSPHTAGQVWMGFAWKLRERARAGLGTPAAIALTNDIVISTLVADASTREDAVREVFIADDNDGNLLNGTPNYTFLSGAATDKAIPYPQIQLASISHTALGNTAQRLTPRQVLATVAPISGSITQVRLHYNAGTGNQVRNMHPTGAVNGFQALLPGLTTGAVSYHIEAVHSTAAIVRFPTSGELSYSITGGTFGGFYAENFDAGAAGWTSVQVAVQNDWQVGDPAGKFGTSQGVAWTDPQTAASGANCYANDLGNTIGTQNWNGAYGANVENYLRSPLINCTGRTGVVLRFKRWLTVEEAAFDQATIKVNGVLVWQNPLTGHLVDTSWQTVEYALPMADNNPSVQIEWGMNSDAGLQLGGWAIDDVELGETIAPSVDCDWKLLPEQAAQGASMLGTITTPGGSRPFLLGLGDTIGPTAVPGFPIVFIGGAITVLGGSTDGSGNATFPATAPAVPSAIGVYLYSQVLTVDAGFTTFVTSNPFFNMFTQTP